MTKEVEQKSVMPVLTEQEVIERLAADKEINFLSAAITPWHAMGIDATILKLTEQGIVLKGYIMIVAHALTGTAISEQNFHMAKQAGIQVIQVVQDTNRRTLLQKLVRKYQCYQYYLGSKRHITKEKKLYWAVPMQPSYDLIPRVAKVVSDRELQIILTDEGIGSYTLTPFGWWKFNFLEGGIKATRNILVRNVFFKHRLTARQQIQYHCLLKGKRGHLTPDEKAVACYRKILAMNTQEADYSYYGKSVLMNPNMLYESGILTDTTEMEIYTAICAAMEKENTKVIIKPHPREKDIAKYEKLTCRVEANCKAGQEVILATLTEKPYCVVGFSSTTLITAKVLFGIEAISANYLIDKRKQRNKKYFREFNKAFHNLIYMPKNMEELLLDIENIKKKYKQI